MTGQPLLNQNGKPALTPGGLPAYDGGGAGEDCGCCCTIPPCVGTYTLDASTVPPNPCWPPGGGGCTFPDPITLAPNPLDGFCWTNDPSPDCATFLMGAVCITDDGNMPNPDPCVLYMGAELSVTNHPPYPFLLWTIELRPFATVDCTPGFDYAYFNKVGGTTPVGTYRGGVYFREPTYGCYTVTVT